MDITKRLRDRHVCSLAHNSCRNDFAMEVAADEIDRLRAGIQRVLGEGAPREIGERYAKDGRYHKGDKCVHGAYRWESCDACTDAYLRKLLDDQA